MDRKIGIAPSAPRLDLGRGPIRRVRMMEDRMHAANRPLYWILGLAFLFRIAAVPLSHFDGSSSDEREYAFLANQLVEGESFVDSNGEYSIKAPLFPLLVALCLKIWPSSLVLPFLVNALLGSVATYVGYLLAMRFWQDRRTALWACGTIAFLPPLVLYGSLLMSESLFIVFLLLTVLLGEMLRHEDRFLLHLLFGITSALAVLTRAAALGFVPLLLLAIGTDRWRRRISPRRLLLAFSVWGLLLLPWTVRNYHVHGDFIPVSTFGGRALLIGNNPYARGTLELAPGFDEWLVSNLQDPALRQGETATEARRIRREQAIALEYVTAHPGRTLALAVQKAYIFWIYPITHRADIRPLQALFMCVDVLLLLAVVCGLGMASQRQVRFPLVWLAAAFFTGLQMILYAEARFRLPLLPFLCLVGAGGFSVLNREQRRKMFTQAHPRRILILGITIVVLLYGLAAVLFVFGLIS